MEILQAEKDQILSDRAELDRVKKEMEILQAEKDQILSDRAELDRVKKEMESLQAEKDQILSDRAELDRVKKRKGSQQVEKDQMKAEQVEETLSADLEGLGNEEQLAQLELERKEVYVEKDCLQSALQNNTHTKGKSSARNKRLPHSDRNKRQTRQTLPHSGRQTRQKLPHSGRQTRQKLPRNMTRSHSGVRLRLVEKKDQKVDKTRNSKINCPHEEATISLNTTDNSGNEDGEMDDAGPEPVSDDDLDTITEPGSDDDLDNLEVSFDARLIKTAPQDDTGRVVRNHSPVDSVLLHLHVSTYPVRLYDLSDVFVTGEKPFTCRQCSASFTRPNSLAAHMRKHCSVRTQLQCNECSLNFPSASSLRKHRLRSHTGKRGKVKVREFACVKCKEIFPKSSLLAVHMAVHTGGKPFKCSDCKATFTSQGNLTVHRRKHSGQGLFPCQCDVFVSHQDSGCFRVRERPFQCEVCGAAFSTSSNLSVHRRVHTGERPFQCEKCGAAFSQLGHLTRQPPAACVRVELQVSKMRVSVRQRVPPEALKVDKEGLGTDITSSNKPGLGVEISNTNKMGLGAE
ncbi:hypothetical protein BaRGS_00026604, partial [Batillaria attramentaria]